MDAIERAIRSALERGDAGDRIFREKVYRQAFAALERALQASPSLTVETAIRRRKALQSKITEIEAEYLPTAPRAVVPEPAPSESLVRAEAPPPTIAMSEAPEPVVRHERPAAPPPWQTNPQPRVEPAAPTFGQRGAPRAPVEPEFHAEDHDSIPVSDEIIVEADGPTPHVPDIMVETEPEVEPVREPAIAYAEPRSGRGRWARVFAALVVVSLLAIGVYMAQQMGLLGGNAARQQELADAQPEKPAAEAEDFEPGADAPPAAPGQVDTQTEWISVFKASDPSSVSAPGDAKAEVMTDSGGEFVRLTSGQSGSAILFDVGQGVLERIAGKRATFDIVARGIDGKDTQMSVACNFGELGDCGRKRYAVGSARADYLFDIDVPAADPGAGGTIAINSDFENTGKSVDVFEIRVSVAPIPASN